MGVALKGLAWDHRRCWGPLDASIPAYTAAHPDLTIEWDRRSLYEFGEGRIEDVVKTHDLVVFDHPFIGEIARDGLLVPFDPWLDAGTRRAFEADSVGRSWQSYQAEGRQWALPIDAAAQVAAYRPDLLTDYGDRVPRSHEEVLALGRRLTAKGQWLGLPLVPTDAMCLIITGAESAGHRIGASPDVFLAPGAVAEVVDRLRDLAALSHPDSWSWNPIRCFEHMIHNDDVVYVPFAFGYVNYASRTEEPHLLFADIPAAPPHGALLGGAGIGVSSLCRHQDEAIRYALHLCGPEFQRGEYVTAGGQPGSLAAWTDPEVNRATRNFFADTLATLQGSYLRPTRPGFLPFFRECTHKAVAAIRGEIPAGELADWLNARHAATSGALDGSPA
ncbi:MAG: extracellular solute-binding protein [Bauldia sp.]|nr:extracellular solute-binding protein [Bauldia sp.]